MREVAEKYTLDIGCIVLAGGKGVRLGRDKTRETVGDRSLLQRVVTSISFLNSEIIIVIGDKQPLQQSISYPRLKIATDIYPGKGSLGGIYTGLVASNSFHNLVVACDMPFLNRALLEYMIELAVDYDVVVPRTGDSVEPLHAVYSQNCMAHMENLLKRGGLKIIEFYPEVKVRYIEVEEIDRFDPEHLSFFNINVEADLEIARELAKGSRGDDKR